MRPVDIVRRLCPRARPEYIAAFEAGDALFREAGISTPARIAHFLAQVLHETDGLRITEESGNYSAKRMMAVWPSRFPTIESAEPYAHNAEKLFNKVYGNRMGNGGPETGDGFRYRGRGLMQTTGREAYRRYGDRCGVDFESNPSLILSAEHALKPAVAEWADGFCNKLADAGNIKQITRVINGGHTGLASRMEWLQRVQATMGKMGREPAQPPASTVSKPAPPPPAATAAAAGAVVGGGVAHQADVSALWIVVAVAVCAVIGFAIAYYVRSK